MTDILTPEEVGLWKKDWEDGTATIAPVHQKCLDWERSLVATIDALAEALRAADRRPVEEGCDDEGYHHKRHRVAAWLKD